MKKHMLYVSLVLALVVMLGSCGKYEEGPSFSLLSKKARLEGDWKVVKNFKNDTEQTLPADAENSLMTVFKDGTGKMSYTQGGSSIAIDFEWEFSDSKEEIRIRVKNFLTSTWEDWETSKILRLTNSEFWVEDTDSGSTDVYITHFEKQ